VNCSLVPAAILGLVGVTAIETSVAGVTVSPVEADTPLIDAPMVVVPTAEPLAKPFEPLALLIAAVLELDELQLTDEVRFWVVLSLYMPVAVNCSFVPLAMLGFGGVIASETRVAADTVSGVEPDTLPSVALTVVMPCAVAVARPLEPEALLIESSVEEAELQVTWEVRFWVVPSLYVPIAVNCSVSPSGTVELVGVTAMDTSVAAVTVSGAEPDTLPKIALTVVEPCPAAVANPFDPAALLMVATAVEDEAHATCEVRFCVEPSLYVPIAVNCSVSPFGSVELLGVTAIDTRAAAVTASGAEPETLPSAALTVVEPGAVAVARPFDPEALLMVATAPAEELQVTCEVRFWVDPSLYVPVAVNCSVLPFGRLELLGVTPIDTSVAAVTVSGAEPDTLPKIALKVVVPCPAAVANPFDPAALLMLATAVEDELQVTCDVRFCVVPSLYVPVAVYC